MQASKILEYLPQQVPFRFVDKIVEIDENYIEASYTFKKNEYFYKGHFPGDPVTPGVILTEAMAQTAVVALGIYLIFEKLGEEEFKKWTTFFTDCQMDFYKPVYPGERVIIKGTKLFFRRMKLKSSVKMYKEDGELVAEGIVAGMGVKRER